MFSLKRGGDESLVKDVGTPWDLYHNWKWHGALSGINCLLLGHNRWATVGGINRHTAHPFDFTSLIGAHNGTLKRQNLLDNSAMFDVDSENLYYHMDINGLDDTLTKTDGAFALTWYNRHEGTMNFIRNDDRELYYVVSECGVLFWASEEWMLIVALSKFSIKHGKASLFDVRKHYSLKVNSEFNTENKLQGFVITNKSELKPVPYTPKYLGYQKMNTTTHGGGVNTTKFDSPKGSCGKFVNKPNDVKITSFIRESQHNSYFVGFIVGEPSESVRIFAGDKHPEFVRLSGLIGKTIKNVILKTYRSWGNGAYYIADIRTTNDVDEDYYVWKGEVINKTEARNILKEGWECAWCSSPITLEEMSETIVSCGSDGDIAVCPHCKNLEEVEPYISK